MKRKGRGGPWGGLWGGASAAWRVGSGDYGGEGGREMKWESWKGDTKWGGGYGVGITRGSCPPRPLSPPPFPHLQPCTMATSLRSSRWYHSVSCSRGPPSSVRLWGGDSSDTQPHIGPPSLSSPPPPHPPALPVRWGQPMPQRPPPILVLLLVPPRHHLLGLSVPPRRGVTAGCHPRVLRHQDLGRGGE